MTRFVVVALACVGCLGCPTPPTTDGGSGGGSAGGVGGSTGGGAAGGSGGSTGGGTGGSGGGSAGLAITAFCSASAQARCDWLLSCGRMVSSERTDCLSLSALHCTQLMHNPLRGAPGYDPAKGAACVAGFSTHPCGVSTMSWPFAACAGLGVTSATFVDAGAPCAYDSNAGYCYSPLTYCAGLGAASCGTCTRWPMPGQATGAACNHGPLHCALNNYCVPQGDGGPDRCELLVPDGQPPTGGNEGCAGGIISQDIDAGYQCGYETLNSACAAGGCGAAAYCRGSRSFPFAVGTCTSRIALGQPCVNEAGGDDGCQSSGSCLDGVCQLVPYSSRDAGSECELYVQCRGTERCLFDAGTSPYRAGICAPRVTPPGACSDVQDCVTSASCLNGVCTPLGGEGDVCAPSGFNLCRFTYDCLPQNDGGPSRCHGVASPGEACPSGRCINRDGGAVVCASTDAGPLVCTDPLPLDALCFGTLQCASHRCESATGQSPWSCKASCW